MTRYSGTQLSALDQVEPYEIGQDLQVFKPASDPETIKQGLAEGWIVPLNMELPAAAEDTKSSARRHRPKGSASGWLESRTGNRKRKKPSVSYYYRWDSPKGRVSEYVKASKLSGVNQMLSENCPALEILEYVIEGKKKPSKLAQTLLADRSSEATQTAILNFPQNKPKAF